MTDKAFITCLWFDTEGEAAANYYASIFKAARSDGYPAIPRRGRGPPGRSRLSSSSSTGRSSLR